MREQLLNIVACTTIWAVSWGVFFLFLYNKRISYTRNFLLTATYFLSIAIITSIVFRDYIFRVIQGFTATPVIVLGVFTLCHVVLYMYLPGHLQEPKEYFEKYPNRQYLKIDKRMLASKSADILAQQIFIVLLVVFLKDAGLTFDQVVIGFGTIFGLLHIPLIVSERGAWPSWHFAAIVILFSIIFPTLILKVQYGFVYTYIIHWLFYITTAVGFWIWHRERQRIKERHS